jgi:ATP-dependent exoDNAse (exonuclease V) beta subunit
MIALDKENHIYTDKDGVEYTSITRFINNFTPQFDFENKSKIYASKYGLNVEEVRRDWKQKNKDSTDFGTKIHTLIEQAINDDVLIPGFGFEVVNKIYTELKQLTGKFHTEIIVNSNKHKIAGTSDLIIENDDSFSVIDFKTNKQIKYTNEFEDKYLLSPIDHLPNSEYFKYSLQLSFYAYLFAQKTNKKVDRLAFYWLKRKNSKDYENLTGSSWVRYNIPYLKEEVEACLQFHERKN